MRPRSSSQRALPVRLLVLLAIVSLIAAAWALLANRTRDALIVYCAHDLIYAEEVLREFERETGIAVVIVGDTEATKSLGLVQRLLREKEHSVCDVFWNNQMLGTVELARQAVLEPYQGKHWAEIPPRFRDDDGLWTGFGGRLRVWIINTRAPPIMSFNMGDFPADFPADVEMDGVAIAQPMFGTTLSHYAVLWDELGGDGLSEWHRKLVSHGVRFVPGNATVKDLVASGVCSIGMTDTDDYFQAVDAGASVTMQPIEVANGATICIPNTIAIIRGTDKRQAAEELVDFLTSPECELRLARSRSRQIPLGSNVAHDEVPRDVQPLVEWAQRSVDLKGLADARIECLAWLAEEFAP